MRGSDLFKTPCSPLTSPAEPSLCQISKSLLHKHCFFLLHYALQDPGLIRPLVLKIQSSGIVNEDLPASLASGLRKSRLAGGWE